MDRSVKAKYMAVMAVNTVMCWESLTQPCLGDKHRLQHVKMSMFLLKNYSKVFWSQKIKLRKHFKISLKWLKFLWGVKKRDFKITFSCQEESTSSVLPTRKQNSYKKPGWAMPQLQRPPQPRWCHPSLLLRP